MPGHDLERHAGGGEGLRLLAATAEDERVAALEAHDEAPREPVLDETGVDLLLGHRVVVGPLRGVDQQAAGGRLVEQLATDQPVVHQHLGATHQLEAAHGDQPGSPGPAPTR